MRQLATEDEARLTYLKRELIKSITHSRYYHPKLNCYDPPRRAMPERVKRLIKEIDELERRGVGFAPACSNGRAGLDSHGYRVATLSGPRWKSPRTSIAGRKEIDELEGNQHGGKVST